jgi:nucleolar protein 6
VLIICRAGGGGKSETRKAKIKEKNEKLHHQRQEQQKRKDNPDAANGADAHEGIHPSRRAFLGV